MRFAGIFNTKYSDTIRPRFFHNNPTNAKSSAMLEYYYRFFKKSYKTKINQLIIDLERLFSLERIPVTDMLEETLDPKYRKRLTDIQWKRINSLYQALETDKAQQSQTLTKFNNIKNKGNENRPTFIDTFAGCGGLSQGLIHSGFTPVLINEIDPRLLETYYFNHDIHIDAYHCGKIQELIDDPRIQGFTNQIDLVVGGPPCQGFSIANRQRILDDPRNVLYRYYLSLLHITRPSFFIMENVKGMMKKSSEILDNFHAIMGNEYSIQIVLLNAKDFGIPQNRERVFVIGTKVKGVSANSIINDILKLKETAPKFTLKDAIDDLPKLGTKAHKNDTKTENERVGFKFTLADLPNSPFKRFLNGDTTTEYLANHTNRYNNARDIEIFARLPQGADSLHESIADIMPYNNRNHIFKDKYFKLSDDEASKTITSHMKLDCNMYIHPHQPRGLSPREAARIQTFPDNYIFMGAKNSWYTQIGNAVPVKLAEAIGTVIIKHVKLN